MTDPRSETEASGAIGAQVGDDVPPPENSKDYWDLVFEQLGRRRLFQFGLAVLTLLYAAAIYAPYLASDRPYVLEAINYKEYEQARKSLYPVTLSLNSMVKKSAEDYLGDRTEGSDQTYSQAVEAERDALAQRVGDMLLYLPEEHHGPLEEFLARVDEVVDLRLADDREAAVEAAGEVKTLAKAIRSDFEPRLPPEEGAEPAEGEPAEDEPNGIELVGFVSYPLIEATTAFEVFFMVLWAFVLLWPLWNRLFNRLVLGGNRFAIRRWRRRKFVGVLGASVAASLLWSSLVGGHMTFDAAPYKELLTSGDIVAKRAVFPPLALGFAETHLAETFRPPTWVESSEMSEDGYYLHGLRAPTPDPETGELPPPKPVEIRHAEPDLNAGLRHLLGTDQLGRDMLVRALWGARVSLAVGIVAMVLMMLIGVVLGALAGYFGGWVDIGISRLIEIFLCFPVFFLILVVVAFVGPSILNIMLIIGFLRWTGFARLTRGEFLRLKEQEFVIAARALGLSMPRIVFRHVLPNAMGPILVACTFAVAAGILIESSLSFLGFGIQLPIPSWGALLTESRAAEHWWIHVFPGFLIFLTVLCYNLVGDGLRDAMDPKMKD